MLDIKQNGDHIQGSPYKFHASPLGDGKVHAYGGGLTHAVCGDPANFVISTKGAGAGGLSLAVEGPSKAEIECQDNKDGTVNVSYLPTGTVISTITLELEVLTSMLCKARTVYSFLSRSADGNASRVLDYEVW